jgi:hypothetical protein
MLACCGGRIGSKSTQKGIIRVRRELISGKGSSEKFRHSGRTEINSDR